MSMAIIRDLDALKRSLAPHLTQAKKAIVFGSAARGDADERSDSDIVIDTGTSRPVLERELDFVSINDIWRRLNLLIHTIQKCGTRRSQRRTLHPRVNAKRVNV